MIKVERVIYLISVLIPVVMVATVVLVFDAYGSPVECGGCGCARACTVASETITESGSIAKKEYVQFSGINQMIFYKAKRDHKRDDYQHCTAPDEYDAIREQVDAGQGDGYTLDTNDGATIWSADRSERIYRCAPPRIKEDVSDLAAAHSLTISGYWRSWSESWTRVYTRVMIVCREFGFDHGGGGGGSVPTPTPEPSTMLLFGAGLAGIAVIVRRGGKK